MVIRTSVIPSRTLQDSLEGFKPGLLAYVCGLFDGKEKWGWVCGCNLNDHRSHHPPTSTTQGDTPVLHAHTPSLRCKPEQAPSWFYAPFHSGPQLHNRHGGLSISRLWSDFFLLDRIIWIKYIGSQYLYTSKGLLDYIFVYRVGKIYLALDLCS